MPSATDPETLQTLRQEVKQAMGRRIEEALGLLEARMAPDSHLQNDLTTQKSTFAEIKRQEANNRLTLEESNTARAKVRQGILYIADHLQPGDLLPGTAPAPKPASESKGVRTAMFQWSGVLVGYLLLTLLGFSLLKEDSLLVELAPVCWYLAPFVASLVVRLPQRPLRILAGIFALALAVVSLRWVYGAGSDSFTTNLLWVLPLLAVGMLLYYFLLPHSD